MLNLSNGLYSISKGFTASLEELSPSGNYKGDFIMADSCGKIEKLWTAACAGDTEKLKEFLKTNKDDLNLRFNSFGKNHSLIIGAFRNRQFETVEFLIFNGGTIEPHEKEETSNYINNKRINLMEKNDRIAYRSRKYGKFESIFKSYKLGGKYERKYFIKTIIYRTL